MSNIAKIKSFINKRIKRCRDAMAERRIDTLIVVLPQDVRYFTGFSGEDSVFVLSAKRKILITDSRFTEQLKHECPGLPLFIRKGSMSQAASEVLGKWGLIGKTKKKLFIGIESDAVTLNEFSRYKKAIGSSLKKTDSLASELRLIKDEEEIANIQKAVRVAEASLTETLDWLRTGASEIETCAYLEYQMAKRGGGPAAFGTIVAYGVHAAEPHARPEKKRLGKNQTILFDWGATINGYRSDLTRCFVAGRIPSVFIDAYKWVLESQLSAINAVKPGVAISEVDKAARDVMKKSRLPIFGHGTGHGIGLDIHENPSLNPKSKDVLQEGMVVTIEPGVYIPGKFGIRIEDDVLVTAKGKKVLSRIPKDVESLKL